jgi:transcriptional regulator with XRE-family HTH domain
MNFGDRLKNLREKSGKSRYRLSQLTGLDQAFLARLETGEKNPSRGTVIRLGLALVHDCNKIDPDEIDDLLLSADYAPLRDMRPRVSSK